MFHAYKVFLATAYPSSELVETMKRLLACLALCASLSSYSQDDNCTVLGVQDLSQLYNGLVLTADSTLNALVEIASILATNDTIHIEITNTSGQETDYDTILQNAGVEQSTIVGSVYYKDFGNTNFFSCAAKCKSLVGNWRVMEELDVGAVFSELDSYYWVGDRPSSNMEGRVVITTNTQFYTRIRSQSQLSNYGCMCITDVAD